MMRLSQHKKRHVFCCNVQIHHNCVCKPRYFSQVFEERCFLVLRHSLKEQTLAIAIPLICWLLSSCHWHHEPSSSLLYHSFFLSLGPLNDHCTKTVISSPLFLCLLTMSSSVTNFDYFLAKISEDKPS